MLNRKNKNWKIHTISKCKSISLTFCIKFLKFFIRSGDLLIYNTRVENMFYVISLCFLTSTTWFLMQFVCQLIVRIVIREFGVPVRGVTSRSDKNIYPRGKFHRSVPGCSNPLASNVSLWFRERLIPHYLLFVCFGDVCVFPSAFDSHLDHLFLDFSRFLLPSYVIGKRLRSLFSGDFSAI